MEVRPGYKQTEVGVIPEDWECRQLLGRLLSKIATGITTTPTLIARSECPFYGVEHQRWSLDLTTSMIISEIDA